MIPAPTIDKDNAGLGAGNGALPVSADAHTSLRANTDSAGHRATGSRKGGGNAAPGPGTTAEESCLHEPRTNEENEAFLSGYRAAAAALPMGANPYKKQFQSRKDWYRGWLVWVKQGPMRPRDWRKVAHECLVCGKTFYALKSVRRVYCSSECHLRHRSLLVKIRHKERQLAELKKQLGALIEESSDDSPR